MKIITADDHGLIREGLKAILNRLGGDLVFVEAHDGASLREQLTRHADADLLLLDVQLPDCSGLELLTEVSANHPKLRTIMVSGDYDRNTVSQALELGASGFLPKTALNQVLISVIQLVMAGGIYVPPEALRGTPGRSPEIGLGGGGAMEAGGGAANPSFAGRTVEAWPGSLRKLGLTERQIDVLNLLLLGKSNKLICRELDLAEATVKVHVRAILRAFHADSRTEVVVAANRMGWSSLAPIQ